MKTNVHSCLDNDTWKYLNANIQKFIVRVCGDDLFFVCILCNLTQLIAKNLYAEPNGNGFL